MHFSASTAAADTLVDGVDDATDKKGSNRADQQGNCDDLLALEVLESRIQVLPDVRLELDHLGKCEGRGVIETVFLEGIGQIVKSLLR